MPVRLRLVTEADLPLLTGDDAPYDSFGPGAPRTTVHDPSLDAPLGGLAVSDESGALLGNVSWVWQRWGPNPQSRNPMIGIWLRTDARGRGAGSTAQRLLVDLFFRHTTTNRVEALTDAENLAEQRALEKAGLRHESTIRGAQWRDGAYRDTHLHAVLREEWAAGR
jgi:RimJ/RimL family protein N-acetyltransferase